MSVWKKSILDISYINRLRELGDTLKSEKLLTDCSACGKQVAIKAKACPHCGAKVARSSKWKWIIGGVVVLTIASSFAGTQKPSTGTSQLKTEQTSSATLTQQSETAALPEKQRAFLAVIEDYKTRFGAAANELQESALEDERVTSIAKLLGSGLPAENWIGEITSLETNTQGKAAITIRLSPEVSLLTWNNMLGDMAYPTMINVGTPVYKSLINMAVGDKVTVSGSFVVTNERKILEGSMTIAGAMKSPEFLFRFTDVSKM
ncbi:zinc ribbon domain-containing protein [Pararhizobium sp. BT-229]|uniref:zinc ribbon domain-containing protein n=1 Tax=Pararhizobium sp. BT-229 TaxID=2986923 RepID=UPI0021F7D870|nr:zinc ribbon domain-containing protein [Pararhizobium sp. BT-229]MCV9960285.1 zinc ribbon domain-containing protein [Pararhizobium sp. BT-229]